MRHIPKSEWLHYIKWRIRQWFKRLENNKRLETSWKKIS